MIVMTGSLSFAKMHTRARTKLPDRLSRDPSLLPLSYRVLVTGQVSVVSIPCAHPGHPRQDAVELLTSVALPCFSRSEDSPSFAVLLRIVANCNDAEAQGGAGIFFLCAGSVCGRSGEFL